MQLVAGASGLQLRGAGVVALSSMTSTQSPAVVICLSILKAGVRLRLVMCAVLNIIAAGECFQIADSGLPYEA